MQACLEKPEDLFNNCRRDQPNVFGHDPRALKITLIICSTPYSSRKIPEMIISRKEGFAVDTLAIRSVCAHLV